MWPLPENVWFSKWFTAFGKTAQAVIKDECPGCGGNNLDFTLGLFEFFGPLSDGAIPITWSFV
jgi:expansin (peptidoglycan-binding protein)